MSSRMLFNKCNTTILQMNRKHDIFRLIRYSDKILNILLKMIGALNQPPF